MILRMLSLSVIALLIAAYGALVSSCNGERLALEDYFQRLETLVEDVDEQVEALGQETFGNIDASSSVQEQVEVSQVFYPGYVAIVEQFQDELKGLDPPVEAEDVHDEFVEAGDDFADALRTISNQLEEVTSQAELDAVFEDDFTALADRIERACFDAQDIADANNVAVDLNCALE